MALGIVQVNKLNLMQGEFDEVENYFLFVGRGSGVNEGKLLSLNNDSDLDTLLGETPSVLKTQIDHARTNAGQNWNACVIPLDGVMPWDEAVDYAMTQVTVEAVIVTDPVTVAADVEAMQAKVVNIMGQYMRPIWFMGTTRALDPDPDSGEAWSDFTAAIKPLIAAVAADSVMIVPSLWGFDQGTLAGRLANKSVTIADTPMRVATGALLGAWTTKPKDNAGRVIDMAILKELADARFSVPQWYPDYPGMYWGDGALLDVEGGDFRVVENLRVVQKAMRRVYPLAVYRVGDRKLNSTPASIAMNQNYFMRPLREMSRSVQIMGSTFPGEVKPPQDGDIVISWPMRTKVEIYMVVRPYNCPKSITCNVMLDLTNYAEA
ncbi:DUF2586 domain-containing protein [Desulfovibrio psychrotolerans]|uniref:Phage tail protein n=1 Tax=Desulfovibrio psychrotolerans TaxID=415242 RepID=A0A7J0BVJ5_9BACT|nr:DUF2586 domain-containing protein [Desulfovibrio psychrotolerans]GFM37737.1 phage tail protein [Desulfovibrio psychrotolerans]